MKIRESDLPNIKKMGIYCITNLLNGKKYVGKTSKKIINRWYQHKSVLNGNYHRNNYFQKAWNKYGEDNFEFSILEIIEPIEDEKKLNDILNFWERYWINYYNSNNRNNGYNLAKGGEGCGGYKWNKEQRKHNSIAHKEYYKKHPEKIKETQLTIKKKRNLGMIPQPWNKGLTKETDERLRNISEKRIGNVVSKETKQKQSKIRKEKYKNGELVPPNKGLTKENSERIRIASEKESKTMKEKGIAKGKNNPSAKAIVQLTLDGKFVREYDYIKQVEEYGFNYGRVKRCVNHKYITKLGDNVYGKLNEEKYIWLDKKEYE